MADPPAPWAATAEGLTLRVRLTPRGGRDAIEGVGEAGGQPVLRARVASPPVDGAANDALVGLLSRALGVPRSAVRLSSGQTGRIKTLTVAGDGEALAARLAALAAAR